jgi:hypothetical protein
MTNGSFLSTTNGKAFVEANQSMQKFLSKVNADSSQESYSYILHQFCKWAKQTPDELIAERRVNDGYPTLDKAQKFIQMGEIQHTRHYSKGGKTERIIKVAELSKARRSLMYAAILSFYKHNRAALPAEKFKITENHTDSEAVTPKTTYMSLEQGKDIIKACKTPYRELFSCMLYGGLGRREALLINAMWPRLKATLAGKNLDTEVLRLDYNFRKNQENAFFTFIPAKILKPFLDVDMPFTVKGKPMLGWHLNKTWANARKRAGVKEKVKPHMYRDLFISDGFVNAKVPQEYFQFMTGHTVDRNLYLQLDRKPGAVLQEWLKWEAYVETELVNESTRQELAERDKTIQQMQQQIKTLQNRFEVLLKEKV